MSAATFGGHMPADLTLDDLAAMAVADGFGHRYELSPEAVLSVMPPAGVEHAIVASRLFGWFLAHGWPVERVLQNCGLRTSVGDGVGGRVPDLTVWSAEPGSSSVWAPIDDLLLAIEIVSRGSGAIDQIIKKDEYARAGIPRYWIVDRDAARTVTMWRLTAEGYVPTSPSPQPLAWVLNSDPDQHLRNFSAQ
jgi:Uma2 family endonuclease